MNNKMVVEVGSFEVPTGEIFAGDPCYSTDTWCAGFVKVKAGTASASTSSRSSTTSSSRSWKRSKNKSDV